MIEIFTSDIDAELKHYEFHLDGKIIYCNCDDIQTSGFILYFTDYFSRFRLEALISTAYNESGRGAYFKLSRGGMMVTDELEGDGDFRSPECAEILREADIVITKPPTALLAEFIVFMIDNKKDFIVLGETAAAQSIQHVIQNVKVWQGANKPGSLSWFTNLHPHDKPPSI